MKKVHVFLVAVALIAAAPFTRASESLGLNLQKIDQFSTSNAMGSGDGAAHKGAFVIQPDFNLGATYGYYYSGFYPGFTMNLDYFVHDYASVGAYVGMNFSQYYTSMAVGVRGVFHWWQLLDDKVNTDLLSDKIDFYFPLHLGVRMYKYSEDADPIYYDNKWYGAFNGGSGLGFRYYFVKQFGVNLEWGWMEMSWAKFGFTVNMN